MWSGVQLFGLLTKDSEFHILVENWGNFLMRQSFKNFYKSKRFENQPLRVLNNFVVSPWGFHKGQKNLVSGGDTLVSLGSLSLPWTER